MASTLLLSAAGSLVTSLLYLYIGHVLRQRQVSADARLANHMFVLWWQALGYLGLLGVAILGLYVAGGLTIWMYQTYTLLVLLVLFVALWGLQFYLVYLYTGSRRSFAPLGMFYAVLFIATVALIQVIGDPTAITDDGWRLQTEPDVELGRAFGLGFVLLIVGPQIAAAVAYFRLFFKTRDATHRYRIALVTGSILVWFGSSFLATALDASDLLAWQLTSRVIGVLGGLVILAAYRPPTWIRARYGIRSIADEAMPTGTGL